MRGIQIDLAQSFEKVVATVLSLPTGCSNPGGNRLVSDVELKEVIRGLHEAANGREVETKNGLDAIALPVAPFLKKKPFRVATQLDFLIAAATRIICGPPRSDVEMRIENTSHERSGSHLRDVSLHQFKPEERSPQSELSTVHSGRIGQRVQSNKGEPWRSIRSN